MAMTNAEKQAAYRERLADEGKKIHRVVVVSKDWQAGFDAGASGKPSTPTPRGIDQLSWYSGYIEGQAKHERQ